MPRPRPDWDERKTTRAAGRGILALAAIAWGGFMILSVTPEGGWQAWARAIGLTIVLLIPAVGCWIRRREAAAAAVGLGVFTASFFDHWAPFTLLAIPMVAAGVLLLWSADAAKPADPKPIEPKPEPPASPPRDPYDAPPFDSGPRDDTIEVADEGPRGTNGV